MGGRINTTFRTAAFALLALAAIESLSAGPFTNLVVFGDSLSDIGNIASATGDSVPGRFYYEDRFSNGPVWVESLATGLGLPPITRSTANGNNFAYGGARTSGTGFLDGGFFIRDIDEQVDRFLATRTADPAALFVVFAGANDLIAGQTMPATPIGSLRDDMERLINAGARNFLVGNLPLLGETPRYRSGNTRTAFNTASSDFNTALDAMLDDLAVANPAVELYRLDVADVFGQALANPASFGLTNVTEPAAPGLGPGDSSYDTGDIAPNAHEYMFWDDLHPTATVHAHLAEHALALFALPGDFNRDGMVDAADYVVWRDDDESAVEDYDLWRANFGRTFGGGASSNHLAALPAPVAVPEPHAFCVIATALATVYGRVRRCRRNP